ncbi:hypothetical protein BJ912DRAFT_844564, partial [Pholiota molesta]
TGYIGGSVFLRLLDHPNFANFRITTLVRSREKWNKLVKMRVNAVRGSLSDLSLLESLASHSDVVLSVADANDLDAVQAILKGLRKHYTETGNAAIFIHTSGMSAFADTNAEGFFTSIEIYDDLNPCQVNALPDTQPHRLVEIELVKADNEGYVKTYIILPSMVYGLPSGRLVDQGIQNCRATAIPSLVRAALIRGRGGMIGPGMNYWPNVHIEDVADLYLYLFNAALMNPTGTAHGHEGFYFAENGEHTLYQVGKAICEAMITVGECSEPEPSTFTDEEIQQYFHGSSLWGCHCRCRANRSRALGWNPQKTTVDMLASISAEVEETLVLKRIYERYGLPMDRPVEKGLESMNLIEGDEMIFD